MNMMPKPTRSVPMTTASMAADVALLGVYEISKILSKPQKLDRTLDSVMVVLSSFLDMRHGLITLIDDEGNPDMVAGPGWSEAAAKKFFLEIPERIIGEVVATAMPVVIQDIAVEPLFRGSDIFADYPEGMKVSFLGVPIKDGDKVIGTLTIDRVWDGRMAFRLDEDVRFLAMIANLVGQTVRLHTVVARDRERLMAEQARLMKQLDETRAPAKRLKVSGIVGESSAMANVLDKVAIVAKTHSTVLLRGESGTGKELFARAIHELSPRKSGPFIKLNCAALPESVLESELFGHEKGAFTGALNFRKGRFEMADGGTLFLDEIGEISQAFQSKLLRVLQEGEFERVGGNKTLKVNVRIVTATNKDLEEAVAKGEFRADLYYRINVVPIMLPALRDRPSDIPLLAREFMRRFNAENGVDLKLTPQALDVLKVCGFPGNVRELENCIRRTATLAHGPEITAHDFSCRTDGCLSSTLWRGKPHGEPVQISKTLPPVSKPIGGIRPLPAARAPEAPHAPVALAEPPPVAAIAPAPVAAPAAAASPGGHVCGCGAVGADGEAVRMCPPPGGCLSSGSQQSERDRLLAAMETAGWVQAKAARILDLTPRQIGYALKKHGIELKKF
ncbi:MAG: nif-specific transcriptional activator NifA [Hyphomicrobiaceae bacterium]|nr:nif-specific transcriptional activator NifA [Hyphomicrobiaceae bacterium]